MDICTVKIFWSLKLKQQSRNGIAHAFNPRIWQSVAAGSMWVQGHSTQHCELQDSQDYKKRSSIQKKSKNN